jgi:hypothetical protein
VVLVGLLISGLLAIGTSEAPAGNRAPEVSLTVFPGPSEATYGQSVAYTATLKNTGKSKFTHVRFHNPSPATSGGPAVFKYASCNGAAPALGAKFFCDMGQLAAGQTATVRIVWQTPSSGTSSDCPGSTPTCMTNFAFWTIKEGTGNAGSAGPDTFPPQQLPENTAVTSLLVVPDPDRAGGYGLTPCTDPSTQATLTTNLTLGPANPFATKVCASTVPGQLFDPGLVVEIDEDNDASTGTAIPYLSEVCIPAPGFTCADVGYNPWVFSPRATFTFVIDNTTLPKGEKVDKVFHDGADVTSDCRIKIHKFTKTTTVTCLTSLNGSWNVG